MDLSAAMTSSGLRTFPVSAATGPISAFDVSSTNQHVAFGDEAGCFHMYSSSGGRDGQPFNQFSSETKYADVVS